MYSSTYKPTYLQIYRLSIYLSIDLSIYLSTASEVSRLATNNIYVHEYANRESERERERTEQQGDASDPTGRDIGIMPRCLLGCEFNPTCPIVHQGSSLLFCTVPGNPCHANPHPSLDSLHHRSFTSRPSPTHADRGNTHALNTC